MKEEELAEVVAAIADTYPESDFVVMVMTNDGPTRLHFGGRGEMLRGMVAMRPFLEQAVRMVNEQRSEPCSCPRCVAARGPGWN